MPKLRDYFFSDQKTFINTNEFAENITINGINIDVVMDNDTLKEQKLKHGGEGLANSELLFHVQKVNYDLVLNKPFVAQRIRIDDRFYEITDLQESEGMYSITLGAYLS